MDDDPNQSKKSPASIFDAALAVADERRAAFLDQACRGDAALRQRVEALLRAYHAAGSFMDEPTAPNPLKTILVHPTEKPGERIDRYKLLQQIGEGGCGVVYMADQMEPVKRRVALKVIKPGMDSKEVLGRFEMERQALALMDHPNIAKVLDAGTTATGRPYFVMEFVRGVAITRFCDENQLTTEQRLKLFVQVCHAVQHAHQKGIIHRDIKPSNVLVADYDGEAVPKVIDFGIAKATAGQTLTDKTVFTALEQFIGTPAYMSPEQAKLSGLDIDTRSDVYSLGVLLYELLTGRTPFDASQLIQAGLDELCRVIREEEPPRPSVKLSTLKAEEQITAAKARRTESPRLVHLIRGDLDWIAMKCLEKARDRRYQSASDLAADILRHMQSEPVVARPPSKLYRLQRTVRRHRIAFAAAGAVFAALAAGLGISTWEYLRERETRQRAVAAEHAAQTNAFMAENNAAIARGALGRMDAANAGLFEEHGDASGSLLWLVQAIKLAGPEKRQEEFRRLYFALTLQEIPALEAVSTINIPSDIVRDGNDYLLGTGNGIPPRQVDAYLSPDGRLVARAGRLIHSPPSAKEYFGYVAVFDTASGKQVGGTTLTGSCMDVAFNPTGTSYVAACSDGIYVCEVRSGKVLRFINYPAGRAQFSADGTRIVALRPAPWETLSPRGLAAVRFRQPRGLETHSGAAAWDVATGQEVFSMSANPQRIGFFDSMAISPGGRFVFSQELGGQEDSGLARLQDLATSNVFALQQTNRLIDSLLFSPAESIALCRYEDGGIGMIDLAHGKFLENPEGFPGVELSGPYAPPLSDAAIFSPDGARLALRGRTGLPRVWKVSHWLPVTLPLTGSEAVVRMAFSPHGSQLATRTAKGDLQLWDADTGKPLTCAFPTFDELVQRLYVIDANARKEFDLNFSADGRFLVLASQKAVSLWNVADKTAAPAAQPNRVAALEFSPDGQGLLSKGPDAFRITDGAELGTNVTIWDAATGMERTRLPVGHTVGTAHFSDDGSNILTTVGLMARSAPKGELDVWDIHSNPPVKQTLTADFDRDSKLFVFFSELRVTGNVAGEISYTEPAPFSRVGGAFRFDYPAAWSNRNTVSLPLALSLEKHAQQEITRDSFVTYSNLPAERIQIPLGAYGELPVYLKPSEDGACFVTEGMDHLLRLYSAQDKSAKLAKTFQPPLTFEVVATILSPDRRKLAAIEGDGAVAIWDTASGAVLGTFKAQADFSDYQNDLPINKGPKAVFSDDQNDLVLRSETWSIFDITASRTIFAGPRFPMLGKGNTKLIKKTSATGLDAVVVTDQAGHALIPPLNHQARVTDFKLSPDEHLAATAGEDGAARLWLADTGEAVSPPLRYDSTVTALAFSPDSQRLAIGTLGGAIQIWNLEPAQEPVEDLELLAELYSGRRLDENNGVVYLNQRQKEEIVQNWTKNRAHFHRATTILCQPGTVLH